MNKQSEILKISKKLGLSHISSCLSVLPILEEIYKVKKPHDKVILDNAHAHLAHLMFTKPDKAETLIEKYGTHCDKRAGCDAYGGSLGHGLGISIGLALANPKIKVYCIVSDGSMMEGSNFEALRIIDELKPDIEIYCNFNGYSAVAEVDFKTLVKRMMAFHKGINYRKTNNTRRFEGIQGHYLKI